MTNLPALNYLVRRYKALVTLACVLTILMQVFDLSHSELYYRKAANIYEQIDAGSKGGFSDAIYAIERARSVKPDNPEYRLLHAKILVDYGKELGDVATIRQAYDLIKPELANQELTSSYSFLRAGIKWQLQEFDDDMLNYLQRALMERPGSTELNQQLIAFAMTMAEQPHRNNPVLLKNYQQTIAKHVRDIDGVRSLRNLLVKHQGYEVVCNMINSGYIKRRIYCEHNPISQESSLQAD